MPLNLSLDAKHPRLFVLLSVEMGKEEVGHLICLNQPQRYSKKLDFKKLLACSGHVAEITPSLAGKAR